METTTNFEDWAAEFEELDYEDVYSLYRAVVDNTVMGAFTCVSLPNRKAWIVKSDFAERGLLLASEIARVTFLTWLRNKYVDDDMEIEGWYIFKRANEKYNGYH